MAKTPHSILDMSDSVAPSPGDDVRPDDTFTETSLPGFKEALNARRSVRVYDRTPIPEEVMEDCLRDATLAPSSSNLQPYELYWVHDPVKKARLAEDCLAQPAATTAAEMVVIVARPDLWDANRATLVEAMTGGGERPLHGLLDEYYNKVIPRMMRTDPVGFHNLVRRCFYWFKGRSGPSMRTPVNRGDHRIWAHIQSSLAAQTLMLSLTAHGFDTCAMGGIDKKRIGELLELPRAAEVSMVIAAGRGSPEGLYGPRLRLPEDRLIKKV